MPTIKINLNDYEVPSPVPTGSYLCEVIKADLVGAKETKTEMIAWEMKVLEPAAQAGKHLFHRSTIYIDPEKDPDTTKTAVARGFLRQFLEACRFQWAPSGFDPAKVIGSKLIVTVREDTYEGRPTNRCTAFTAVAAKH